MTKTRTSRILTKSESENCRFIRRLFLDGIISKKTYNEIRRHLILLFSDAKMIKGDANE